MSDTHAQSVGYVQETQIPPSPPPAAHTGALHRTRENLFPTVSNALTAPLGT